MYVHVLTRFHGGIDVSGTMDMTCGHHVIYHFKKCSSRKTLSYSDDVWFWIESCSANRHQLRYLQSLLQLVTSWNCFAYLHSFKSYYVDDIIKETLQKHIRLFDSITLVFQIIKGHFVCLWNTLQNASLIYLIEYTYKTSRKMTIILKEGT